MTQRQEIYCHECGNYVQFDIDLELNGNHVLECPKCGHEHCRVVKDGEITDERWDSRNQTFNISNATSSWSTISTLATYLKNSPTFNVPIVYMPVTVDAAAVDDNDQQDGVAGAVASDSWRAHTGMAYGNQAGIPFLYDGWMRLATS